MHLNEKNFAGPEREIVVVSKEVGRLDVKGSVVLRAWFSLWAVHVPGSASGGPRKGKTLDDEGVWEDAGEVREKNRKPQERRSS